MKRKIYIALIIIFFCFSCGISEDERFIYPPLTQLNEKKTGKKHNFYQIVLDELSKKKIVMISDNFHGHQFYHDLIIATLYRWVLKHEKEQDTRLPRKLLLVLEFGKEGLEKIQHFLKTADLDKRLGHLLGGGLIINHSNCSIDQIEYYYALRSLMQRIKKINKSRSDKKRIYLKIVGPELDHQSDYYIQIFHYLKKHDDKYQKKEFLWFTKTRDQLTAKNLIETIKEQSRL